MEAKKNLPYIPLYTGDWEKDCNVLSLEAEAAWLRIIFKMFNNGKQSSYKLSTKALQNLWRVTEDEMFCIIDELLDNDICGIEREERYITFTSRRYEKENIISEIRKEAVSKRKDRTKPLQKSYKTPTKDIQNTEYEIEIEYKDDINKELIKEKNPFDLVIDEWYQYKKEKGQSYKSQIGKTKFFNKLYELSGGNADIARQVIEQSMANNWAGIFELKQKTSATQKVSETIYKEF